MSAAHNGRPLGSASGRPVVRRRHVAALQQVLHGFDRWSSQLLKVVSLTAPTPGHRAPAATAPHPLGPATRAASTSPRAGPIATAGAAAAARADGLDVLHVQRALSRAIARVYGDGGPAGQQGLGDGRWADDGDDEGREVDVLLGLAGSPGRGRGARHKGAEGAVPRHIFGEQGGRALSRRRLERSGGGGPWLG